MRAKFILICGFIVTGAFVYGHLAVAKASLRLQKGVALDICKDVYSILQMPENNNYIEKNKKDGTTSYRELFYIPENHPNFEPIKWEEVSAKEYAREADDDYTKRLRFIGLHHLTDGKIYKFGKIKKAKIDVFNTGTEYLVYDVEILRDGDMFFHDRRIVNQKVVGNIRFFNDNIATSTAFSYKGQHHYLKRSKNSLIVVLPKIAGGQATNLCVFSSQPQDSGD